MTRFLGPVVEDDFPCMKGWLDEQWLHFWCSAKSTKVKARKFILNNAPQIFLLYPEGAAKEVAPFETGDNLGLGRTNVSLTCVIDDSKSNMHRPVSKTPSFCRVEEG